MARTLLDEVLNFRIDWIEHQLTHAVKDANGCTYSRTKHLKKCHRMMQRWVDYLDELRLQATGGNVAALGYGEYASQQEGENGWKTRNFRLARLFS